MITAAEVAEALDYDPATGIFRWRWRRSLRNCINARDAGQVAGAIGPRGYRGIGFNGRTYRAHRLAWLVTYGVWPTKQVDHINGMRDDNRLANLRLADGAENHWNRGPQRNGAVALKGVHQHRNGRYRAEIMARRYREHLGYFDTAEEAHAAYLEAARRLHGEFANGGSPQP